MTSKFVIKDLFKLPGDVTVLACDGSVSGFSTMAGFIGEIKNDGELRQSICFSGERKMLNKTHHKSVRAFETSENVRLTTEEAQSGTWYLFVD